MLLVTLDTNVLIDMEERSERGEVLHEVRRRQHGASCRLRVPAISASELQRGKKYLRNFGDFMARLTPLGFSEHDLLLPIAYWGVAFWDRALFASEEASRFEHAIHDVLFDPCLFSCPEGSGEDYECDTPRAEYVTWRNAKCDVLAMWCHIHYGGDVFVTADENFHKVTKQPRLVVLGAKSIVRPEELPDILAAAA